MGILRTPTPLPQAREAAAVSSRRRPIRPAGVSRTEPRARCAGDPPGSAAAGSRQGFRVWSLQSALLPVIPSSDSLYSHRRAATCPGPTESARPALTYPAGEESATGCSCIVSSPSFVKAAPAAEKISPTWGRGSVTGGRRIPPRPAPARPEPLAPPRPGSRPPPASGGRVGTNGGGGGRPPVAARERCPRARANLRGR